MKKISAAVLAMAVTASLLAGCGQGSSGSGAASSNAGSSQTSAPAAKQPVTLKYMTWNYADTTKSTDAYIKDMKDKFNIIIEMQNVPTDQYESAVKAKLAAKDLPDLMNVHSISNDLVMEKVQIDPNQFADLSDLISVSEYLPSLIQNRKSNKAGKLFYVPNSTNALGVIYNKKVFKDNGIAIPTNINEFTAAADKLKQANVIPIAGGFKDSWTTQIINFIAFGQYINAKDMSTRVKLADRSLKYADIKDDIKKVLSVQLDWIDKGYFPKDYLGTDINVASQMVGTGKAAMLINGTWQYKAVQDADPKADIGFFALPLNAPGEKTVVPTTSDEGIVVNAQSKNLEAAKIAMDYYLSAENQTRVLNEKNGIPTNSKVKVNNAFATDVNTAFVAGVVQPDFWGVAGLYKPSTSSFAIDKEMQNLIANGITIDQFIQKFDEANAPK